MDTTTGLSTSLAGSNWLTAILKLDPNSDSSVLGGDATGAADAGELASDIGAVKSNWCADCHDSNPNWNETEVPIGSMPSSRTNPRSHVQGPVAEGSLEVYSVTMSVAGWGTIDENDVGADSAQDTTAGCTACHNAPTDGNDSMANTATQSAFPHQSKGTKLMFDSFTQDNVDQNAVAGIVNDGDRIVPNMDALCGKCHSSGGNIGASPGVGSTF